MDEEEGRRACARAGAEGSRGGDNGGGGLAPAPCMISKTVVSSHLAVDLGGAGGMWSSSALAVRIESDEATSRIVRGCRWSFCGGDGLTDARPLLVDE